MSEPSGSGPPIGLSAAPMEATLAPSQVAVPALSGLSLDDVDVSLIRQSADEFMSGLSSPLLLTREVVENLLQKQTSVLLERKRAQFAALPNVSNGNPLPDASFEPRLSGTAQILQASLAQLPTFRAEPPSPVAQVRSHSAVKLSLPPVFTGSRTTTSFVHNWCEQMSYYLSAAREPESSWVSTALTFLAAQPQAYYRSYMLKVQLKGQDPFSWSVFVAALKHGYAHIDDEEDARHALSHLSQGKLPASQYSLKFRALLSRLLSNPLPEVEAIRLFSQGLQPSLRAMVVFNPSTGTRWSDLDALIQHVVVLDAELHRISGKSTANFSANFSSGKRRSWESRSDKSNSPSLNVVSDRQVVKKRRPDNRPFRNQSGPCNQSNQSAPRQDYVPKCALCDERGHPKWECPLLPPEQRAKVKAIHEAFLNSKGR